MHYVTVTIARTVTVGFLNQVVRPLARLVMTRRPDVFRHAQPVACAYLSPLGLAASESKVVLAKVPCTWHQ